MEPVRLAYRLFIKHRGGTAINKVYEYIQERIVKALEEAIENGGYAPWQKPWDSNGMVNYISRKQYRGVNRLLLPENGEYITFNQISTLRQKDSEIKLKKGCKKYMVVFWKFTTSSQADTDSDKTEEKIKKAPLVKYYYVYNINDVYGLQSKFKKVKEYKHNPIEQAELTALRYFAKTGVNFKETDSDVAFYIPAEDFICVPKKIQFKHIQEYYSTLFHEITHSTGHKNRLNRIRNVASNGYGIIYSKEELIAEIGSCMVLGYLGIENENTNKNSHAYLYNWLCAIKKDICLIVSASQKAQVASDYILGIEEAEYEEEKNQARWK